MEGWSRDGSAAIHYELPVDRLVGEAGLGAQATVAAGSRGRDSGLTRNVTVPGVDGLVLAVTPEVPGALRLAMLRVVLLVCLVAGGLGLVAARRALAKEARAMARERAFVTTVTHELRTPLAAIRLFGETLAEGRGDPREYGALVAQESERLSDLVERVLAATRVDEAPRFGPVSPRDLAASVVDLIGTRAERRHVRIECHADDDVPEAQWDADAVGRALLNLIDNAVKHGKEGGQVEVRVFRAGGQVKLSVADDGPGHRCRSSTRDLRPLHPGGHRRAGNRPRPLPGRAGGASTRRQGRPRDAGGARLDLHPRPARLAAGRRGARMKPTLAARGGRPGAGTGARRQLPR